MTNANPFFDTKNNPFLDPKLNPFMNAENPFFSQDAFSKLFEKFEMKGFDIPAFKFEDIFAAQQKNFEAISAANKAAAEGIQAAFAKQAEALNKFATESNDIIAEMTKAGEPQEKIAKQAEITKEAVEKSIATMREITDLVAASHSEALDILNSRLNAQLDEFKTTQKPATTAAPKKAAAK